MLIDSATVLQFTSPGFTYLQFSSLLFALLIKDTFGSNEEGVSDCVFANRNRKIVPLKKGGKLSITCRHAARKRLTHHEDLSHTMDYRVDRG